MADDRERNQGGQGRPGGGSQAPGRNPDDDQAAGNPAGGSQPGGSQRGGQDRRPGQGMEDEDDERAPRR